MCKWGGGKVEREDRGAEWPSTTGASIEGFGEGVSPFPMGEGLPPPQKILSLKMATFGAFWALFLQFIVHSSMDCLKHFRHKKPLLVGKLAVVCMQIALGDKTSVLETTL